jgi:hypothetical protein
MGSAPSEDGTAPPLAVFKIVVAGGFGAGKTTLVSAISEVRPLSTEELLTSHDPQDVRIALDLDPGVPAMRCDARQPASVKRVLIALVEHVPASGPASGSPPRTDRSARLAGQRRAIPAGTGLPGKSG